MSAGPRRAPRRGRPQPAARPRRIATALSACLLFAAAAARAQEPAPGIEIAPFGGLIAFDQDFRVTNGVEFRGLEDSFLFGGRVGYTFGRWFGFEGSLGYGQQTISASSVPGSVPIDVSYVSYAGEGLVPLAAGNVTPFLAAGLGGLSLDVGADPLPKQTSSGLVASFGGGLKLPISRAVLVRVDARDLLVRTTDRAVTSIFGGDGNLRSNITLTGGVSLRFGGPRDTDRDGVRDDRDACPDTPAGSPVDKRGCVPKAPPAPPPVKTDADGDGVSDALDKCPGTPAGTVVDLDGCPAAPGGTPPGPSR